MSPRPSHWVQLLSKPSKLLNEACQGCLGILLTEARWSFPGTCWSCQNFRGAAKCTPNTLHKPGAARQQWSDPSHRMPEPLAVERTTPRSGGVDCAVDVWFLQSRLTHHPCLLKNQKRDHGFPNYHPGRALPQSVRSGQVGSAPSEHLQSGESP